MAVRGRKSGEVLELILSKPSAPKEGEKRPDEEPDVVAPGTNIYSCSLHNRYAVKSGTSMATPVVSGAMALLLEKYPYYTNKDAKKKLKFNCDQLNTPRSHQGWGRINVQKLLELP